MGNNNFTIDEKDTLLRLLSHMGCNWIQIALSIPTKPPDELKEYFNYLLIKIKKLISHNYKYRKLNENLGIKVSHCGYLLSYMIKHYTEFPKCMNEGSCIFKLASKSNVTK